MCYVNGSTLTYAWQLPSQTTNNYFEVYTIAQNAAGGRTTSAIFRIITRVDVTNPRYFVWKNFNPIGCESLTRALLKRSRCTTPRLGAKRATGLVVGSGIGSPLGQNRSAAEQTSCCVFSTLLTDSSMWRAS